MSRKKARSAQYMRKMRKNRYGNGNKSQKKELNEDLHKKVVNAISDEEIEAGVEKSDHYRTGLEPVLGERITFLGDFKKYYPDTRTGPLKCLALENIILNNKAQKMGAYVDFDHIWVRMTEDQAKRIVFKEGETYIITGKVVKYMSKERYNLGIRAFKVKEIVTIKDLLTSLV